MAHDLRLSGKSLCTERHEIWIVGAYAMRSDRPILLIPISALRPTEKTLAKHVLEVKTKIERTGLWTHPICVESSSFAVMDGHHRLAAARLLSLSRVPCVAYNYSEVLVASRRAGYKVDDVTIVARALTGALFPFKTTRHAFPDRPKAAFSIQSLRRSAHSDVLRAGSARRDA
jgi:hypothetical protein